MMASRGLLARAATVGVLGLTFCVPAEAIAQNRVGGHFGAVFPLVTRSSGETVDIGDDFKIGFPMGITVRTSDLFAFDLELVPVLDTADDGDGPIGVPLTIHPGALLTIAAGWTGGLRMAFDIGGASWGFTPLLNARLFAADGHAYFVEFVVPIRFQDDDAGDTSTAVGFGVHVGVGF
jgi:hypothetical protein